jgi:hypothetical protein
MNLIVSSIFFENKTQMETKGAALSAEEGVTVYYAEKVNITGLLEHRGQWATPAARLLHCRIKIKPRIVKIFQFGKLSLTSLNEA